MTQQQGDDPSFAQRLQAARAQQGLDAQVEPLSPAAASAMGVGMRVGVELVAALVVGLAIGWALDRFFHTMPLFLIVFVLLGGAAGILNVWRMMGPRKA